MIKYSFLAFVLFLSFTSFVFILSPVEGFAQAPIVLTKTEVELRKAIQADINNTNESIADLNDLYSENKAEGRLATVIASFHSKEILLPELQRILDEETDHFERLFNDAIYNYGLKNESEWISKLLTIIIEDDKKKKEPNKQFTKEEIAMLGAIGTKSNKNTEAIIVLFEKFKEECGGEEVAEKEAMRGFAEEAVRAKLYLEELERKRRVEDTNKELDRRLKMTEEERIMEDLKLMREKFGGIKRGGDYLTDQYIPREERNRYIVKLPEPEEVMDPSWWERIRDFFPLFRKESPLVLPPYTDEERAEYNRRLKEEEPRRRETPLRTLPEVKERVELLKILSGFK